MQSRLHRQAVSCCAFQKNCLPGFPSRQERISIRSPTRCQRLSKTFSTALYSKNSRFAWKGLKGVCSLVAGLKEYPSSARNPLNPHNPFLQPRIVTTRSHCLKERKKVLATTYFPTLKSAVSSARAGLTSEFGMESGISPPPWSPGQKLVLAFTF